MFPRCTAPVKKKSEGCENIAKLIRLNAKKSDTQLEISLQDQNEIQEKLKNDHCKTTLSEMYMLVPQMNSTDCLSIASIYIDESSKIELSIHATVLHACSKWFRSNYNSPEEPAFKAKNFTVSFIAKKFQIYAPKIFKSKDKFVFEEFIEFCYTGSFTDKEKTVEQLCSILKAMSMLEFDKGRQETVKLLCSRYEVSDFEVIQELTEVYPIAELSNIQWSKTFENFNEFVSGVAFPNLSKESITEICEKFKIYTSVFCKFYIKV